MTRVFFARAWMISIFCGSCMGLLAEAIADEPPPTSLFGVPTMLLKMPGVSFRGELPPLTTEESKARDELKQDVHHIAGKIGERNYHKPEKLLETVQWIEHEFAAAGHTSSRHEFNAHSQTFWNIEVEIPGTKRASEILVVGAHYDSVRNCPAADDNGSGVVALLAMARRMQPGERTLRLVAFANEELLGNPGEAGSEHYAKRCKERGEQIVGMLSLETIGYFRDEEGSQKYPLGIASMMPTQGNFIAFVANSRSSDLVQSLVKAFRDKATIPSEGAALPDSFESVGRSDQRNFWLQGYPGLMVTDTANYRNPNYHQPSDTPDTLDYDRFARVTVGLVHAVQVLLEAH